MYNNKRSKKLSSKIGLRFISMALMFLMIFNVVAPVALAAEKEKVTGKPLVILMEFADYKFADIDKKEKPDDRVRGVKGKDFTPEYVNEWLFAKDTYTSQDWDGEDHEVISIRKALSQVSGGTYDFNGEVVGPYQAKRNAKHYGRDGQESTRYLIEEAVEAASKDPNVNLADFDVETRIRDVDTNETHITYNQPDGQVDTVIVIHPGIGGEWGGGSLGKNAIHPYRRGFTWHGGDWNLQEKHTVDHNGDDWRFDDFLIVSQDGASDIVMHEFGHIMGLPDLYATGAGDPPVQYWDIMGGSYTGINIPGDGPLAYGAYNRYYLQKSFEEGGAGFVKWANIQEFDLADLNGQEIDLQRSSEKMGDKTDLIKINLPKRETEVVKNEDGETMFFTGKGDDLRNSMIIKDIDLTDYEEAFLEFDAWYKIDPYFDFVTVRANESGNKKDIKDWETLEGNLTTEKFDDWLMENETEEERKERNPGHGMTANSKGWKETEFNLSEYAGKKIDLAFYFHTDSNTPGEGMYFDNMSITGTRKLADLKEYKTVLEAVKEAKYTEESWTTYQKVVKANTVTEKNTQEEVDGATLAIEKAQKNLVVFEEPEPEPEPEPEDPEKPETGESELGFGLNEEIEFKKDYEFNLEKDTKIRIDTKGGKEAYWTLKDEDGKTSAYKHYNYGDNKENTYYNPTDKIKKGKHIFQITDGATYEGEKFEVLITDLEPKEIKLNKQYEDEISLHEYNQDYILTLEKPTMIKVEFEAENEGYWDLKKDGKNQLWQGNDISREKLPAGEYILNYSEKVKPNGKGYSFKISEYTPDKPEEPEGPEESEPEKDENKEWEDIKTFKADDYTQEKLEKEFVVDGFEISTGKETSNHYYLLEWRKGDLGNVDGGLENMNVWNAFTYEPGMLVWYVNEYYIDAWGRPDQNTSDHPGYVFAGIVDADQNPVEYYDSYSGYGVDDQMYLNMHDAAFNLKPESKFYHNWDSVETVDRYTFMVPDFDDSRDYSNKKTNLEGGLILEELGLKFMVIEEKGDRTGGRVKLINKNNKVKNNKVKNIKDTKGLNVEGIKVVDNVVLTMDANNNGSKDTLGKNAYISYIHKETKEVVNVELFLKDGQFISSLSFMEYMPKGDYEVDFIILEDQDENAKAIYNSNLHSGVGSDLSDLNLTNTGEFDYDDTIRPEPEPEPEPETPEKVNKKELENKIAEAKEIDLKNKTEESVKVLNESIIKGMEILVNEEATQEEVNQAIKEIELAIEGLEDKKDDSKDKPGQDDSKDKPGQDDSKDKPGQDDSKDKPGQDDPKDKPGTPDKNELPKTGQSSVIWISIIGFIILALGASMFIKKDKIKN